MVSPVPHHHDPAITTHFLGRSISSTIVTWMFLRDDARLIHLLVKTRCSPPALHDDGQPPATHIKLSISLPLNDCHDGSRQTGRGAISATRGDVTWWLRVKGNWCSVSPPSPFSSSRRPSCFLALSHPPTQQGSALPVPHRSPAGTVTPRVPCPRHQ